MCSRTSHPRLRISRTHTWQLRAIVKSAPAHMRSASYHYLSTILMASNHLASPDPELAPILATLPTPDENLLKDFAASRAIFSAGMAVANSGQTPLLPPGKTRVYVNAHGSRLIRILLQRIPTKRKTTRYPSRGARSPCAATCQHPPRTTRVFRCCSGRTAEVRLRDIL